MNRDPRVRARRRSLLRQLQQILHENSVATPQRLATGIGEVQLAGHLEARRQHELVFFYRCLDAPPGHHSEAVDGEKRAHHGLVGIYAYCRRVRARRADAKVVAQKTFQ